MLLRSTHSYFSHPLPVFQAKQPHDFIPAHLAEGIRSGTLTRLETESAHCSRFRFPYRVQLDHRLACLGDNERLALGCLLDQARKMSLYINLKKAVVRDFCSDQAFKSVGGSVVGSMNLANARLSIRRRR